MAWNLRLSMQAGGLRGAMLDALRRHKWHVTAAARELGVPRSTFYRRMNHLKIVPPNLA